MNNSLRVKIFLPSSTMAVFNADLVTIPGTQGMFGVLPGHINFLSNINIGVIDIYIAKEVKKIFVHRGIAEVSNNRVNIITEFAALLDDMRRHKVINKINELKSELLEKEESSTEFQIIRDNLLIYQDLLGFVTHP